MFDVKNEDIFFMRVHIPTTSRNHRSTVDDGRASKSETCR